MKSSCQISGLWNQNIYGRATPSPSSWLLFLWIFSSISIPKICCKSYHDIVSRRITSFRIDWTPLSKTDFEKKDGRAEFFYFLKKCIFTILFLGESRHSELIGPPFQRPILKKKDDFWKTFFQNAPRVGFYGDWFQYCGAWAYPKP